MPKFKPEDVSELIDPKCHPCRIEITTEPRKLDRRIVAKDGTVLCHCDGTRREVFNCLMTSRQLARMHIEDIKIKAANIEERFAAEAFRYLSGTCTDIALSHLLDKLESQ